MTHGQKNIKSFKEFFTLCISVTFPSTLMDSVQFHVAKYFEFHYKNVTEANQMDVGDDGRLTTFICTPFFLTSPQPKFYVYHCIYFL
jgi:hypothetical protein